MRVFIDGRDDIVLVDGPTGFGELLEELEEIFKETDRTIKTIKVDGRLIDRDALQGLLDKDVNEFEIIELETVGPAELALEELVKANSIMLDIKEVITQFIESGSLNYQDGVANVITAMNSWERLCRKIDQACQSLGVDYTKLQFSGTDFSGQHKQSLEIIEQLTKALSLKDIVQLRDILEYKFLPQMDTYTELIKAIISEFERKSENL